MRWVNRKIVSKAVKLPWLEISPERNMISEKSEFEVFFSGGYSDVSSELKSSLDEVSSTYEQSINYLPENDEPLSEIQEIEIVNAMNEIREAYIPVSQIKTNSKPVSQNNLQKNILDNRYFRFNETDIQDLEKNPEQEESENFKDSSENDFVINQPQAEILAERKLEYIKEFPMTCEEIQKLEEPEEVVKNEIIKEKNINTELPYNQINHQNLIPAEEKYILNPFIAESFNTEENIPSEEILDNTDEEYVSSFITEENKSTPEFLEPEDSNDDISLMKESARASFRCSVTPELKSSSQFHIPFNILHTGASDEHNSDPHEIQQIIEKLESTLDQFGIEARVIGMQRGPIITRYEIRIPPGIKVNRILSLTDELAMALEALRVRIEAPIPGRSTVGIEIPNKKRSTVLLGDILNHPEYNTSAFRLPLPLGKDIAGNLLIEDLCKMPHILIAGATGSGKSVAINAFITNLIITKSPEEVRMLMVDPKLVELSQYNDIPHLLHPVISDAPKAILALNWAVEEMDRRYEDMADLRARDIIAYNLKVDHFNKTIKHSEEHISKMPYIIILIDELGDLMMVAGKEVESSIIRLSQKARAIGIHLILATQRPSVDVITALIKANCPARIALQVAQKTDSRTILDSNGGEQLLGQGDMLFKHPSRAQLIRAQAPYVTDQEVENVVNMVKKLGKPSYIVLEDPKARSGELEIEDENLFDEAWEIIVESNKASASYLQRRLRIGYNRAARIIEAFEARGYIGPQVGSKPREIFNNQNQSRNM